MPIWKNVIDVYEDYEQQKGFFRKLFNSRSEFMVFLAGFIAGKDPAVELSAQDIHVLLIAILQIPANLHARLSYQLAKCLVGHCMSEGVDSSLFRLCRNLYASRLFFLNHWNIFYPYRNRQDFTTDFLSVHDQLTQMHMQRKLTLLLNTEHHHTPEKGLAKLFLFAHSQDKAIYWYKKAIDLGQSVSIEEICNQQNYDRITIYALAEYYESRQWDIALNYYLFLGQKNHAPALRKLTGLYYEGHPAFPADVNAAILYYRRYLDSDQSSLQSISYLLSDLWEALLTNDQKNVILEELFECVALLSQHQASLIERTSPSWCQALGYLFLCANNVEKAQHWYQQAIDEGESESLDLFFFTTTGLPARLLYQLARANEQKHPTMALRCYEKAADLDSLESLLRLGELYQANSFGILPNESEALTYYERAQGLGCLQAIPAMKRLTEEMTARREARAIPPPQDPWSIWANHSSSDDEASGFEYDHNPPTNRLLLP